MVEHVEFMSQTFEFALEFGVALFAEHAVADEQYFIIAFKAGLEVFLADLLQEKPLNRAVFTPTKVGGNLELDTVIGQQVDNLEAVEMGQLLDALGF